MKRREFLRAMGAAGTAAILGQVGGCAVAERQARSGAYPTRILGKTGRRVSIVAFGGLSLAGVQQQEADAAVREAVEQGISYFDVAPSYGDAESKMGPALAPYRDKVFLACKTAKRDRAGAGQELKRSLDLMQTDHFDLYQLHHITDVEKDVKAAFAKGGAMEAVLEARRAGLIRYIGFSAHSQAAAFAAMKEFEFDTAMFPVNFVCHYANGFENEVLAEARRQKMGVIALKAMAKQSWGENPDKSDCVRCWYEPVTGPDLIRKSLGWTLAQEGVCVAIPPADLDLTATAIALAPTCDRPATSEIDDLRLLSQSCRPIFG